MQKTDCVRPRFKCKAVRKLCLQISVPICETTSATTRWLCGCGSCPSWTRGHIHEPDTDFLVDSSLFSLKSIGQPQKRGQEGYQSIGLAFLNNRRCFLGTLKGLLLCFKLLKNHFQRLWPKKGGVIFLSGMYCSLDVPKKYRRLCTKSRRIDWYIALLTLPPSFLAGQDL
jgi:hypothetical protein